VAKTVDEAKAVDIAGEAPVTPVPTRISSEEEANEFVKGQKIPKDVKTIYVTEDCNLFFGEKFAHKHSERNNLKIFTLNEWTK
jgi:hypothetical protein